ncbi:MAG: CYTH domain-containing protein [Lachnospiraceae bacterium]|nr:CYTH domain-containing protein [Lachnospiraceae bacterium]
MEIERKFTVKSIPDNLTSYPSHKLEQAYLCTSPVVRVRKEDDTYYLTYKGKGFLVREEANLPLTEEAYLHLKEKADGLVITKERFLIPYEDRYTIELDIFAPPLEPLVLAEVEFQTEEEALAFQPPHWFDKDVTNDPSFTNSQLSKMF